MFLSMIVFSGLWKKWLYRYLMIVSKMFTLHMTTIFSWSWKKTRMLISVYMNWAYITSMWKRFLLKPKIILSWMIVKKALSCCQTRFYMMFGTAPELQVHVILKKYFVKKSLHSETNLLVIHKNIDLVLVALYVSINKKLLGFRCCVIYDIIINLYVL